ncbi:MAG: hypothetical protein CMB25_08180 [Euryarchaeota archaeon]|nr:hypothetical protein [Euryarchaeota archaeon]
MGIFDFLLGKPQQTVMDDRSLAARNFILDELDRIYQQGPIDVPKYFAQVPEAAYSGTNNLLASLGMDTVTPPNMGDNMANVGGMDVYSSEALARQMQEDFANRNPSLYNELTGNVPSFTDVAGVVGSGSLGGLKGNDIASYLDPNNRMGMAEHMERQKKNYAKRAQDEGDTIINYGQAPDGGVYAIGYGAHSISPAKASELGLIIKDKNPFDMTFGEHMGAMGSDVKDMATTAINDLADVSIIGNLVKKMTGGNDSKQSSFHDDMVAKAQERAKQKTAGLTKTEKRGGAELDSRFGISGL